MIVKTELVPIIGLTQVTNSNERDDSLDSGRIVVYGDSNCIDSTHIKKGINALYTFDLNFILMK